MIAKRMQLVACLCWAIFSVPIFAQDPSAFPLAQIQGASLGILLFGSQKLPEPKQPFELDKVEAEYIDKFLDHWQMASEKIQRFNYQFKRYDFDSDAVNYCDPNDNRLAASQLAVGRIFFERPGRGYYETEQHWEFKAPPKEAGGQAEYSQLFIRGNTRNDEFPLKEKWICDGDKVFEFNFDDRVVYVDELPAALNGTEVIQNAFPLLVGAPKDEILKRFWVRPIAQANHDEFWLEAHPKNGADAIRYSKVEVVLAREDFLPKAIHFHSPHHDPQKGKFQSRYFMLENREVKKPPQAATICTFPGTPIGWKRVNRTALYKEQQAVAPGHTSGQLK